MLTDSIHTLYGWSDKYTILGHVFTTQQTGHAIQSGERVHVNVLTNSLDD